MEKEQNFIRKTNARFARFLKDNAITLYNDVLIDYLLVTGLTRMALTCLLFLL